MPLSPSQAMSQSPAARLDDEEKLALVAAKTAIDHMLSTQYTGLAVQTKTDALSSKVAGYLMRAYATAGWTPSMQPIDGRMAKAQEILAAGGSPEWVLTLVPDWTRGQ